MHLVIGDIVTFMHNGQQALKFGWSKDPKARIKTHSRFYPDMRVWCVLQCASGDAASQVELTFQRIMDNHLHTLTLECKHA